MIGWAESIGPNAAAVVAGIMKARPHPEQGYRSVLALIRDAKRFGPERTEAACGRALKIGNPTRKTVVAILRNNLEQLPLDDATETSTRIAHDNVRGGAYFDLDEDNDTP